MGSPNGEIISVTPKSIHSLFVGIPKIYLTNLVKEGKLVRVSRGFYMLPDSFEDDYYKIQLSNSDAIFSFQKFQ